MLILVFQFQECSIKLADLKNDQRFLNNVKKGIELFNNEQFWDCHEELEEHWLATESELEKYIYWLIIQVATINYHYFKPNIEGASGLLVKSQKKVEKIKELTDEVILLNELVDWNELTNLLGQLDKNSELKKFTSLSVFKFKNIYG